MKRRASIFTQSAREREKAAHFEANLILSHIAFAPIAVEGHATVAVEIRAIGSYRTLSEWT